MKLSNKILLGLFILVIFVQLFASLKARSIIKKATSESSNVNYSIWLDLLDSDVQEKTFDVKNFDEIKLKFRGNAVIQQADEFKVIVKGPIDFLESEFFRVEKSGDQLSIKCPNIRNYYDDFDIVIMMPELKKAKIEQHTNIKIEGFKENKIKIRLAGDNYLTAQGNKFGHLELNAFGETNCDFQNSSIDETEIRCLGESDIKLDTDELKVEALGETNIDVVMSDGKIKGKIIGEGKVRYSGEIDKNSLVFIGSGNVRRK